MAKVSFKGLTAATPRASAAARGASAKHNTKPEQLLRRALWKAGHRYRKNRADLPGRPDIVFAGARLAVFCDGDYWHGRDWEARKRKLAQGHNATYWIAKIERNRERDRENVASLEALGWRVLRFWESDIKHDPDALVKVIAAALDAERR